MNDNRQLLQRVHLDLHGPALDILNELSSRALRVRVKVDGDATPKNRSNTMHFDLYGSANHVKDPEGLAKSIVADVVARYNSRRPVQVTVDGLSIGIGEIERPKRVRVAAPAVPVAASKPVEQVKAHRTADRPAKAKKRR